LAAVACQEARNMARRTFYSFHYTPDNWRASQVRNAGVVDGNVPVSDNDWEAIKRGGEDAIKRWINGQLDGTSCAIVLIGTGTAGRKWINYEIEKAWNDGKGVLGVYIHNLKDRAGYQSAKGKNPFDEFTMKRDNAKLSSIVRTYDPPYTVSTDVYAYIKTNLAGWVETAISIRTNY
jgi:Thoeris protein ThsB, TIR-like domain